MIGTPGESASSKWTPVLSLAVFGAVFLAYFPSLHGGLVWNDSDYVTKPALRSLTGLGRIWTEPGATEQYYPLLHSSFWLQHRLWGDLPLGYHLFTLALHAGASVLFALVLRRLAVPGAWLAACLFALHPVHVSSVAWIAEQKNTLSLVFYLAAALAYLRFDETRGRGAYVLAFGLFALSLLCKTVTATLPAALLVILWWRRGRLGWSGEVRPLAPWLVVAAASAAFTGWVERHFVGAGGENFELPLVERVLVAGRSVWLYLGHLLWPWNLGFIYPRWIPDPGDLAQWLGVLGLALVGLWAWRWRRRTRTPLAVYLLFIGSLIPVLGFVSLFGALYSWVWDHWQYLPDLAPIALLAAGLTRGWEFAAPRRRPLGPILAGLLLAGLGVLTWGRTGMFRDEGTLYRATLARNPSAWMARNNLGNLLAAEPGGRDEAIANYVEALRLRPDYTGAHNNLANLLAGMPGREEEACFHYEQALRLRPDHYTAHANLANLLARLPGRQDGALAHYQEALRLRPDYAEGHVGLANLLARLPGRQDEALAHYRRAITLKPDLAVAHNGLALLLAAPPGRPEAAMAEYREALRLDPRLVEAHNNLANLLVGLTGREAEARSHYEQALTLNPRLAAAHSNLANLLAVMPGRESEAVAHYETALGINPDFAQAHLNLALLLARLGRFTAAMTHCRQALRLDPGNPAARDLLGSLQGRGQP